MKICDLGRYVIWEDIIPLNMEEFLFIIIILGGLFSCVPQIEGLPNVGDPQIEFRSSIILDFEQNLLLYFH